jgi:hypothetical protein
MVLEDKIAKLYGTTGTSRSHDERSEQALTASKTIEYDA